MFNSVIVFFGVVDPGDDDGDDDGGDDDREEEEEDTVTRGLRSHYSDATYGLTHLP